MQEDRHVKVGSKPITNPQVYHWKNYAGKYLEVLNQGSIRFPFDIGPSNPTHKEKQPVYHLRTGPFTVTHMSLFGQQPAPGYQSAVPLLNLSYGTIGAPLAHFSSLDVSQQGAEGRNSVRTFRTIINVPWDVATKVPYVQGTEQ